MEPVIRPMRQSDLPELVHLFSDPEVMRYLLPPDSAQEFLQEAALCQPPLVYAVEDEAHTFLGYVIYHAYDEDSVELGWVLKRAHWGGGLAKALTRQMLIRAKAEYKTAVIECAPAQAATIHIAQYFGFSSVEFRDGLLVFKKNL
ncbi:MAG: GNAT family N-acetyltransferase [Clostridia bacterium]|nr:GNAT family N-acetyltransferase [Clostridia bacterium]